MLSREAQKAYGDYRQSIERRSGRAHAVHRPDVIPTGGDHIDGSDVVDVFLELNPQHEPERQLLHARYGDDQVRVDSAHLAEFQQTLQRIRKREANS